MGVIDYVSLVSAVGVIGYLVVSRIVADRKAESSRDASDAFCWHLIFWGGAIVCIHLGLTLIAQGVTSSALSSHREVYPTDTDSRLLYGFVFLIGGPAAMSLLVRLLRAIIEGLDELSSEVRKDRKESGRHDAEGGPSGT